MPIQHTVRPGEGVSSIAFRYGFFPDTVWNDPANAELKSQREDPDILAPGDVVTIPDKREKVETRPTGASHRFQRRGVPAILRLQVTINDEIRANQPYELVVDGITRTGMTDDEGVLEASVSPAAKQATVRVGPDGHELSMLIGYVRPIATLEGVKSRLNNLDFGCGDPADPLDDETRAAIMAFEESVGLPPTGDWQNAAFRQKLQEIHDTTEDVPPDEEDAAATGASPAE